MILLDILHHIKERGLKPLYSLPPGLRSELLRNLGTIAEHLPNDIKLVLLDDFLVTSEELPPNMIKVI